MRAQLGFLHMALQLSRHRLLKILFFPPIEWSFYPCWNHLTTDTILLPDSQFFSIDHMCILKSHCFRVCCFSSLHCLQYGGSNSCGMFKAQQSNTTRNTPVTKHLGLVCCSKGEHTYQRFPRVSGEKSSERGNLHLSEKNTLSSFNIYGAAHTLWEALHHTMSFTVQCQRRHWWWGDVK